MLNECIIDQSAPHSLRPPYNHTGSFFSFFFSCWLDSRETATPEAIKASTRTSSAVVKEQTHTAAVIVSKKPLKLQRNVENY